MAHVELQDEAQLDHDELQDLDQEIAELLVQQEGIAVLLLEKTQRREERANASRASTRAPSPLNRCDSGLSMGSVAPSYMRHTASSKQKIRTFPVTGGTLSRPAARNDSRQRWSDWGLPEDDSSYRIVVTGTELCLSKNVDGWWHKLPFELTIAKTGNNSEPRSTPTECLDCEAHVTARDEPFCAQCEAEEIAIPLLVEKIRLHEQSKLPRFEGPIPFHVQLHYKETCERKAKEAFWLALHHHWPMEQQDIYPEGPEQIRFGRNDLTNDRFGTREYPGACLEMCGQPRRSILDALYQVVDLRNSIAHLEYSTPEQLFQLMSYPLRLAVQLGNEKIAMDLQALINEASRLAYESGAEMVRNQEMVFAGQDVKWKLHHQRFFMAWRRHEDELPDIIAQAARDWNNHHDGYDEDDDFLERVSNVKSWARRRPAVESDNASSDLTHSEPKESPMWNDSDPSAGLDLEADSDVSVELSELEKATLWQRSGNKATSLLDLAAIDMAVH